MEQERQDKWNRKQGAGLVKGKGWVLEAALDWMPRGHGCKGSAGNAEGAQPKDSQVISFLVISACAPLRAEPETDVCVSS